MTTAAQPEPALPTEPTNTASRPTTGPAALLAPPPIRLQLAPTELLNAVLRDIEFSAEELNSLKLVQKLTHGEGRVWEMMKPAPGREADLLVLALFDGSQADLTDAFVPGDVRAYVMPTVAAAATDRRWFVYTLSRVQPAIMPVSSMTQETFMSELGAEFEALGGVREAQAETIASMSASFEAILAEIATTTTPAVTRLSNIEKIATEAMDAEEDEEGDDLE